MFGAGQFEIGIQEFLAGNNLSLRKHSQMICQVGEENPHVVSGLPIEWRQGQTWDSRKALRFGFT